ncbi:MAG: energy transducer TonB [Bacteroidetes bacterium]|nr:energy transducer TonB [Bacteroidota bacterium]
MLFLYIQLRAGEPARMHVGPPHPQAHTDQYNGEHFRLVLHTDKACQVLVDEKPVNTSDTLITLLLPVGVHVVTLNARHYYGDTVWVDCTMPGMEATAQWYIRAVDTSSDLTIGDIKFGGGVKVQNVAGYPYHFAARLNDEYEWADVMPEYIGGEGAFMSSLHQVSYSDSAADVIRGKVRVSFVVEKDGSVSDIQVQPRELERYSDIVARVQAMRFRPGKIVDTVIRVRMQVPIFICLR